jgi:hypothetical protein
MTVFVSDLIETQHVVRLLVLQQLIAPKKKQIHPE